MKFKNLMKELGNPQDQLKIIHVAGTNGKGSVCAMLSAILIEAGYTVGLFTSPHLMAINERIQIQGQPISQEDFQQTQQLVKNACQEEVIFFERLTAMAFVHFARQEVDIVILETGIGGKLDATNIIKQPLLSVITSIGKDHVSYLGHTIQEIAREKGGIIKDKCPAVLYDSEELVYNIIKGICTEKKSPLFSCKNTKISNEKHIIDQTIFDIDNTYFTYDHISLQLLGKYQVSNATTALMAIKVMKGLGYTISDDSLYKGLKGAIWPGRMEVIQKEPPIIFDGAHNRQSAQAFITSLLPIIKHKKVHMLIGVLEGKDYEGILEILLPYADLVTVTQSAGQGSVPAQTLHQAISKMENHPQLLIEEDGARAYEKSKQVQGQAVLCCLGSFYLIGELKHYLKNQEDNHVRF